MMLECYIVSDKFFDLKSIKNLYQQSFPKNELSPFKLLLNPQVTTYAFYDKSDFIGFISILGHLDIINIIYFAIANNKRSQGYGSQILSQLKLKFPKHRIIADIEAENKQADNNLQRQQRKRFYLKNGFHITTIAYHWRDEDYIILIDGNDITAKEFDDFWNYFTKNSSLQF